MLEGEIESEELSSNAIEELPSTQKGRLDHRLRLDGGSKNIISGLHKP